MVVTAAVPQSFVALHISVRPNFPRRLPSDLFGLTTTSPCDPLHELEMQSLSLLFFNSTLLLVCTAPNAPQARMRSQQADGAFFLAPAPRPNELGAVETACSPE